MVAFKGGDKLARRLQEIAYRAGSAKSVRAGFPEGATYPDGTSVPMVAAVQEFGGTAQISGRQVTVPARPYFRPAIAEGQQHWGEDLAKLIKANDYDARKALKQLGEQIAGEIRASIGAVTSPPLASSTVRGKGSSKPLIDSGLLLRSVDCEVEE